MKLPLSLVGRWASRVALVTAASCALAIPSLAADSAPEKIENSALNAELVYEILLGEMNVVHGETGAGFSLLLDAARKSGEAQLYERAVDLALQARSGDAALLAARSWTQAWPQDRKANYQVLQILLALNQIDDSLQPLRNELALAPESELTNSINLIPLHYARVSDKKRATSIVQEALGPYLAQNDFKAVTAWTSLGRMRLASEDIPGALEAVQKGQALDAQAQGPTLLALELMAHKATQAEPLIQQALRQQNTIELSLRYVRVLVELGRYAQATAELNTLTNKNPQLADAWLLLGSLQFEQGQDKEAEASLSRYVNLVKQAPATPANTQGLSQAQIRRASLLARQGRMNEARQFIAQLPAYTPEEQRSRLLAEVQLLREHRQWQTAFDLLAKVNSNDVDLMYEQAMLAEKLNQLDEMEKLLRAILAKDPRYYNAYNALGFSLADRNIRLHEARQLILKALSFVPNDPFILDSLGWVEFRLGDFSAALAQLQKAYAAKPDVEIAAHLGEVLWRMSQHDQARKVWREGLALSPNNETLQKTLQRLQPEL